MRRRELISLLCGASAWPFAASAQQAMVLVGLLTGGQVEDRQINALRQALREAGYIEGRNLAIKYRSAGGRFDRLPELAAELVADPVAAIFAAGPSAAVAAKAATATIPIVFVSGADPIDLSLVASLNRPGGNVTGVTFLSHALGAKRLELLRELVPSTTAVGFLVNPKNPNSQSDSRDGQAAAPALGLRLLVQTVTSEREFEAAFAGFDQQRVDAIIVSAPAGGPGGCSFRLVRERGGDDALKAFAVYNDSTCPKPVISPSTVAFAQHTAS
jgi:putative ABC transport system substrate-binding protein